MKRQDLIQRLGQMGCVFIGMEGSTTGIKTPLQKWPNQFRDIVKSISIWHGTF